MGDPDDDNGSDSDSPEESIWAVNEPSTSRGRGCGRGRKMRCGSGCVHGPDTVTGLVLTASLA